MSGSQFFEGGCLEKRGWLFSGGKGCSFYMKNKLKTEIFSEKNVYKQKCFFCQNLEFKLENF